jgi:hypothetical protein
MKLVVPAIISLFALALAVRAGEPLGEVLLRTIPFGPGSNWRANDTGATERSKFSVKIDNRTAINVTTNSAGSFINLPLDGEHLVKIKVDGKPLTSFRFSFEGRSRHLVLSYDEARGTWSLSDVKPAQK